MCEAGQAPSCLVRYCPLASPAVTLLLQLFGCFAAVFLVRFAFFDRSSRRSLAVSTAVVATVLVSALGLKELWPADTINAAERQSELSSDEAAALGAVRLKINAGYVEWVVAHTPPSACYRLTARNGAVRQWVTYRMLPRLGTDAPRPGCWLVFYAVTPKKAGYTPGQLSDSLSYAPKFSLARLKSPTGTK
jgi:hypothetical protein